MAKDKVIFNFKDGEREIKVGDQFVSMLRGSLSTQTVIKIGRDLITCKRDKFYIKTGESQSDYTSATAYSSLEAYKNSCIESKFIQEVQNKVKYEKFNFKQAVAISKILEDKCLQ